MLARGDLPPDLQASLAAWSRQQAASPDPLAQVQRTGVMRQSSSGGSTHGGDGGTPLRAGSAPAAQAQPPLQLLASPSIGTLQLRRVLLSLQLDEQRMGQLLTGCGQDGKMVGSLLGCFGSLFSVGVAPRGQGASAAPGDKGKLMLSVRTNEVWLGSDGGSLGGGGAVQVSKLWCIALPSCSAHPPPGEQLFAAWPDNDTPALAGPAACMATCR